MSDFRTQLPNSRASYRTQNEEKKVQLLGDLAQALDIQHHDTSLRHTFGAAFEAPVEVVATAMSDVNGFIGISDSPARADHRHGISKDAWLSWTPVLTAATTNPTLGSGSTQEGRYVQLGSLVAFWGRIAFGSAGAAAGSGNYRVSSPVNLQGHSAVTGGYSLFDSNTGNRTDGQIRFVTTSGSTNLFRLDYLSAYPIGTLVGVTNAAPWTWAASDQLNYWGVAEAA